MSALLDGIWRDAWRPPDRSPPWLWAHRHIAAIPYSPIPGRFRIENSPHIREPLEAIVDPAVRQVCILASVQSSKTTAAELALCYVIANLPGPTLWLNETDDDAKDQAESRLHKLFEECEPVTRLFPRDRHKKRTATIHFANGMTLWVLGAHNKTNLQRRSIRWIFADECWSYPQGHMAEAEARVTAFGWLGKCIWMSQGGEEGDDFDRKFGTTDMREWTFECPHCHTRQPWSWEQIEWSKTARDENGEWDFAEVRRTAAMRCVSCNFYFDDSDRVRRELNTTGRFVAQNLRAAKENVGFHWNSLSTMSWGALAELYLRAKAIARRGDISTLKQFWQKRMAQPWREYEEDYKLEITRGGYRKGELWEDEAGVNARGQIVAAPYEPGDIVAPLRILTVDCQMDHVFAVVRSWSATGSSRLIWNERLLTFEDVDALQARFDVHPSLVFLDAGYATYDVYRECAKRGWVALMGDRRATFVHRTRSGKSVQRFYSPRRKVVLGHNRHCFVHYFSALNIKDALARVRRNQNPERGGTWEVPSDIEDDYLTQMEGEQRVKKSGKWLWERIGKRPQHFFDCEVMQVCAATMLKLIGAESELTPPVESDQGGTSGL
jgi:phage terminase large subunit GpA-like protein